MLVQYLFLTMLLNIIVDEICFFYNWTPRTIIQTFQLCLDDKHGSGKSISWDALNPIIGTTDDIK